MFTGIIETTGTIEEITPSGDSLILSVRSSISSELRVDQSVSHNGVCLTVTRVTGNIHTVAAVAETLQKTNLGSVKRGDRINLERSLTLNQRIDGHLVQGHVDATGTCIKKLDMKGSTGFRIRFPDKFSRFIIEKGSIALNGISLTVFDVTCNEFTVAIIPYTLEHTVMNMLNINDQVNLEFDLIGKYVANWVRELLKT